jgi:hypothetical protein
MTIATENAPDVIALAGRPLSEWVTAKEGSALLGVSRLILTRLADRRLISRRCVPGCKPRYLRSDIERLSARSIEAASSESVA